ncbi:transcriptional regulator [Embleya sp. NPDC056575]|uniref:tetratricopeptide repeat protein n=1 Tax=unclassified Embleya TaxID=2699296 RepID=UPI00368B8B96
MAGDAGGKATELAESLRKLYERAGSPTYATLVRQGAGQEQPVVLSTTVLSDWFNGRGVPADPVRFAFLVRWLEQEAARRNHAYVATPTAAWERLRGEAVRERRPMGRPHTPRDGEPTVVGEGFAGRPVREFTDPFALEVHRAIEGPEHTRAGLPVLPVYVPRAHDQVLHEAVERATGGESTMVTLVAGSSTGKTRACWEALHGVPDGWRLWHPIAPGRPEAALAELSAVGPRTVVWLNEAQFYLEPAGAGERVAAELRELLRDRARAPVLVLATLWPDPFWNTLTSRPSTDRPDPHAQARALLTGTDVRVPEAFTGTDLETLRAKAGEDPRLAHALASGTDGRVAQFLAGALALLKRLDLAPAHGRAVLEAAMDARRLGHGPVLRQGFLEDAADAYLTDDESDALADDWFEQALAYTTERVHGATAPLTRIRPRRRTRNPATGDGPTYRLADYLEQHARHTRGALCPGTSFWNAAHDHARTTDDTLTLGRAAYARLRIRHAERLYAKAANADDPRGWGALAYSRHEAGDLESAERFYRQAADAGDTEALERLVLVLADAGDLANAEPLAREAAEAGSHNALMWAATACEREGDREAAERLAREAADAGHFYSLSWLAELREQAGDHQEAEDLARRAAGIGHPEVLTDLALLRERAGDRGGVDNLYREAADAGDVGALMRLAALRRQAGDHEGAEHLYRKAADTGIREALTGLALLREQAGDHESAEHLARQANNAGSIDALTQLATLREEAGDHESAERLVLEAAEAGNLRALTWLGATGEHESAQRLYRKTTDTRNPEALVWLAALRERLGDREGAEHLYREAADMGNVEALKGLVLLREQAGDRETAERLARQAADAGNFDALTQLAVLREKTGDHESAEHWARQAAIKGNYYALAGLALLREQAGDRTSAEHLARQAAVHGHSYALSSLAEWREKAGDHMGAERLAREAVEAGNRHVLMSLAHLRQTAGDHDGVKLLREWSQQGFDATDEM